MTLAVSGAAPARVPSSDPCSGAKPWCRHHDGDTGLFLLLVGAGALFDPWGYSGYRGDRSKWVCGLRGSTPVGRRSNPQRKGCPLPNAVEHALKMTRTTNRASTMRAANC